MEWLAGDAKKEVKVSVINDRKQDVMNHTIQRDDRDRKCGGMKAEREERALAAFQIACFSLHPSALGAYCVVHLSPPG